MIHLLINVHTFVIQIASVAKQIMEQQPLECVLNVKMVTLD